MAKYFSLKKTPKNGYTFEDLALYLSLLDGAEHIFPTKEYKIFIRDCAILYNDKTKPCYLDLSSVITKDMTWDTSLFTAQEFIKEINKDIFKFVQERAAARAREM